MPEELSKATIKDLEEVLPKLKELTELTPALKAIVEERREQEIFNKRAAQIGRGIVVIAAAVGAVIATAIAVSKLIVSMGK